MLSYDELCMRYGRHVARLAYETGLNPRDFSHEGEFIREAEYRMRRQHEIALMPKRSYFSELMEKSFIADDTISVPKMPTQPKPNKLLLLCN